MRSTLLNGHTGLTRHLTVIRILTLGKVKYYDIQFISNKTQWRVAFFMSLLQA